MSNERKEFLEALIKVQSEIGAVYKDKINPHFKNKYVPLNSILEEIKPILNNNGFFLSQILLSEEGQEVLKTEIIHISGESISSKAPLNIAEKNNPQKYGSAMTYMRRYSLSALLCLEEEDDDGKRASAESKNIIKINNEQLKQLEEALDSKNINKIEWCKLAKINSLRDLAQSRFENALKNIQSK